MPAASLAFLSSNITNANALVSPDCRYFRELLASFPCLLYMRESAAVYILFQAASSSPGGVGLASGYLYLNPGALLDTVLVDWSRGEGAPCAAGEDVDGIEGTELSFAGLLDKDTV